MKRKWLIGLLSILMVLAVCFGFAACGGEGGGAGQGGQQGSGTQTDQEIADAAIASLKTLVKDGETASAYKVLGQTKVNGTMYDIVWTVTSSDVTNISDYVQIGTMDETSKQTTITIVKGDDPITYKLKATVTVNSASASMEVTKTIPAKPKDAAGTLDDPYSPSKVIEIASTLGTAGTYYYSDADKGKEVPTVVWVEGYIVNCGNGTQFGSTAVGWVYIADEYDANKTYNNTNSLCVYRIEYDEENLTSFDDLALGKKIKLHGHIEWYQGKNDSAPYAELASFKKSDNTYSDIYCDYLEKEERTPAQKIELALSKVNATMTVTAANDVELPVSTVKDVTFEWSTTDTTYAVSDNKLHVSSLPTDADKTITITVKATCGTENDTKDVTVTIKKAAEVVAGSEVYDFSGLTGKGTGLTEATALDTIKGACSAGASKLTAVSATNIYNGNGQGGAYENTAGLLKFGKSGEGNDGTLTLTFSENVSKIVINCHDWFKKSSQYPDNSNTISVNDATAKTLPYNETGAGGDVEFVLAAPSKTVKIFISLRGFVFNFTVTFAEGGSTTPGGGEDTHTHDYSYTTDTTTWKHTGTCAGEGCTEPTVTGDCTIVNNVCSVCGHEYTTEDILTKLFALTENGSLKGSYKLTGKVLRIDTAYASNYHNITFTIKVNDKKLMAYRAKDNSSDSIIKTIAAGDEVVISGTLKLYNGTYEFDTGCVVESNKAGTLTDEEKIMGAVDVVDLSKKSYTEAGSYTLPAKWFEGANNEVNLAWAMKETSDYASIDNDGKLVITAPPAEEAEAKLTVTISSGSATVETKDITIKIIALRSLITNDGTAEHPLTVAEAFEILNILSSGETYQSGGADKEFYIKGYVTDIGALGTSNGKYGLSSVYIADTAETAKDKSLLVYNLNWDENVLVKPEPMENPLLVGDQLIIKGYLIDHNGTKEVDKSSTNVYPTATQWDKVERPAADPNVIYSLNSGDQEKGTNSVYANNCDVKCNGVTWNVEGNSQQQPWRFGGKSMTEAVDRKLTGKTAITGTVAKITLQLTDSGSITINSVTLKVYSSDPTADGAVAIATKNIEYQKDTEITITPDAVSEWTDCYYQLIFNVTVSGKDNKYVAISKLEFSKAPAEAAANV